VLRIELKTEGRTDEMMGTLIHHPKVREAIKDVIRELIETKELEMITL